LSWGLFTWLNSGKTLEFNEGLKFLPGGLILGLTSGLLLGIVDGKWFRHPQGNRMIGPINGPGPWRIMRNIPVAGLISVLVVFLWSQVSILKDATVFNAFSFGLLFELIFGRRRHWQGARKDIQTVDALGWSWSRALTGATVGFLAGLILAVMFLAFDVYIRVAIERVLGLHRALFLLYGLVGGLIGLLSFGLGGKVFAETTVPNQGIWLSAVNSLLVGLSYGVLAGLVVGLLPQLRGRLYDELLGKLLAGLATLMMAMLWYGALDFIQHFMLRFFLWRSGHLPWRYAHFLDDAAERIFLRKVGGGYIFVHRLLQEYFASLQPEEPTQVA